MLLGVIGGGVAFYYVEHAQGSPRRFRLCRQASLTA